MCTNIQFAQRRNEIGIGEKLRFLQNNKDNFEITPNLRGASILSSSSPSQERE